VSLGLAVVAIVASAAVFFVLGGLIVGSGPPPSPGPGPVARQAATAWLAARSFTGPRAAGVPADLNRTGALPGSLQPAAQWHHGSSAGESFIVAPPDGGPYGLTVVTEGGRLALPPTFSPLPFVSGNAPPVPGRSRVSPGGTLPAPVAAWLQAVFGPDGTLPPAYGLGVSKAPQVLASWSPAGGAGGQVLRIRLALDSAAPGTAAAKLAAGAEAANAGVAAGQAAVAADQKAVAQATAAARTAAAALAAANPAAPPDPALVAAAGAANGAVIAANAKGMADTVALAAAQAAASKAVAAVPTTSSKLVATYDVWMRAQTVVGYAPAAYG